MKLNVGFIVILVYTLNLVEGTIHGKNRNHKSEISSAENSTDSLEVVEGGEVASVIGLHFTPDTVTRKQADQGTEIIVLDELGHKEEETNLENNHRKSPKGNESLSEKELPIESLKPEQNTKKIPKKNSKKRPEIRRKQTPLSHAKSNAKSALKKSSQSSKVTSVSKETTKLKTTDGTGVKKQVDLHSSTEKKAVHNAQGIKPQHINKKKLLSTKKSNHTQEVKTAIKTKISQNTEIKQDSNSLPANKSNVTGELGKNHSKHTSQSNSGKKNQPFSTQTKSEILGKPQLNALAPKGREVQLNPKIKLPLEKLQLNTLAPKGREAELNPKIKEPLENPQLNGLAPKEREAELNPKIKLPLGKPHLNTLAPKGREAELNPKVKEPLENSQLNGLAPNGREAELNPKIKEPLENPQLNTLAPKGREAELNPKIKEPLENPQLNGLAPKEREAQLNPKIKEPLENSQLNGLAPKGREAELNPKIKEPLENPQLNGLAPKEREAELNPKIKLPLGKPHLNTLAPKGREAELNPKVKEPLENSQLNGLAPNGREAELNPKIKEPLENLQLNGLAPKEREAELNPKIKLPLEKPQLNTLAPKGREAELNTKIKEPLIVNESKTSRKGNSTKHLQHENEVTKEILEKLNKLKLKAKSKTQEESKLVTANERITLHGDPKETSEAAIITVCLILIISTIVLTIVGVYYRKISIERRRYIGHRLLETEDEMPLFNRETYHDDVAGYESWNSIRH